ncbi:hypothetical protein GCM10020254_01770 [Streptomyces goshikiensis]
MVAHGGEALRQTGEDVALVMGDGAEEAVPRLGGGHDLGALALADALVAQAHAEHGHGGGLQDVRGDAEVAGPGRVAGSGGDHDVVEGGQVDAGGGGVVVGHDDRFDSVDLGYQLEQVVGVRVVVVDQQGSHHAAFSGVAGERQHGGDPVSLGK